MLICGSAMHPFGNGAFVLGKTRQITARAAGNFANKDATQMTGGVGWVC